MNLQAPRPSRHRGMAASGVAVVLAASLASVLARSALAGLAVAVVVVAAVRSWGNGRAGRRCARERAAVRELLGGLALELQVGQAPEPAFLEAAGALDPAALPPALAAGFAAASAGGDVPAALALGPPELRALAAAWRVTARTGAPLAAAAARLAETARTSEAIRAELDTALAGPAASARLLAGLPVLGCLLAAGLGARPLHLLLHTALGASCLVAGLLLEVAGTAWTGRLVASARRSATCT